MVAVASTSSAYGVRLSACCTSASTKTEPNRRASAISVRVRRLPRCGPADVLAEQAGPVRGVPGLGVGDGQQDLPVLAGTPAGQRAVELGLGVLVGEPPAPAPQRGRGDGLGGGGHRTRLPEGPCTPARQACPTLVPARTRGAREGLPGPPGPDRLRTPGRSGRRRRERAVGLLRGPGPGLPLRRDRRADHPRRRAGRLPRRRHHPGHRHRRPARPAHPRRRTRPRPLRGRGRRHARGDPRRLPRPALQHRRQGRRQRPRGAGGSCAGSARSTGSA